uniref:Methyltransferase domain-containing protein n=1 Tax=Candidatus Kentrum sp. TC TaxID=2126339 RepID=A0A450Z9K3_9GAMM|nr:MAG: hypothetical protein BECKTC1821D_GA0114238_110412 [Candidatus Kentron sp. TC]
MAGASPLPTRETGDRSYDVILFNNSIYYLEPFEENILYFLKKLKRNGALIILYLDNNFDYGALISGICEKSGIPHESTSSSLPMRLFAGGDDRDYRPEMVELLKHFYLQSHYDTPLSDAEFLEALRTCSDDGFLNMGFRLLVIREKQSIRFRIPIPSRNSPTTIDGDQS